MNAAEQIETAVDGVPSRWISHYWPQIAPLLDKPMSRMDMYRYYSLDDVKAKLESAQWQCWVVCSDVDKIDTAFVTYIEPYPTGRNVFTVFLAGGENMQDWVDMTWSLFKDFAAANGCEEIRWTGREGWQKVVKRYTGDQVDSAYVTYEWKL